MIKISNNIVIIMRDFKYFKDICYKMKMMYQNFDMKLAISSITTYLMKCY